MMKVPAGSLIPNTCNFEEDKICLDYVSAFWDCAEISCTFIFENNLTMGCQGLECMKETCTCLLLHIRVIDAEFIKCGSVLTVAFHLVVYHMKFLELWKSAVHFFADFFLEAKELIPLNEHWHLHISLVFGFIVWLTQNQLGISLRVTDRAALLQHKTEFSHILSCMWLLCPSLWAYTLRRAPWWWMDFCYEQCQNMLKKEKFQTKLWIPTTLLFSFFQISRSSLMLFQRRTCHNYFFMNPLL